MRDRNLHKNNQLAVEPSARPGNNELLEAILRSDHEAVATLLKENKADANAIFLVDRKHRTALMVAIESKASKKCIQALVYGDGENTHNVADPNAHINAHTALDSAIKSNNEAAFALLVEHDGIDTATLEHTLRNLNANQDENQYIKKLEKAIEERHSRKNDVSHFLDAIKKVNHNDLRELHKNPASHTDNIKHAIKAFDKINMLGSEVGAVAMDDTKPKLVIAMKSNKDKYDFETLHKIDFISAILLQHENDEIKKKGYYLTSIYAAATQAKGWDPINQIYRSDDFKKSLLQPKNPQPTSFKRFFNHIQNFFNTISKPFVSLFKQSKQREETAAPNESTVKLPSNTNIISNANPAATVNVIAGNNVAPSPHSNTFFRKKTIRKPSTETVSTIYGPRRK